MAKEQPKDTQFTLRVPKQPEVVPPRTEAEQAMVDRMGSGAPDRATVVPRVKEGTGGEWTCDATDPELWAARVLDVANTPDMYEASRRISRVMNVQGGTEGEKFNAALADLARLSTREGLESVLVEQIASLHAVSTQASRNMFAGGLSFDAYSHYSKAAARASAGMARCAEALERIRNGVRPAAVPDAIPETNAPSVTVERAEDAEGRGVVVGHVKRAKPKPHPDLPAQVVGAIEGVA